MKWVIARGNKGTHIAYPMLSLTFLTFTYGLILLSSHRLSFYMRTSRIPGYCAAHSLSSFACKDQWFLWLISTLLLSEPVRFVKKLEDVSHELGKPLRLLCTYTGSQRVHVTWKKDDKPIWASYQYNVKTTNSSCTLEVLNSDRAAAAGKYTCEISNAEGTDTCHAHVKIGNTVTFPSIWLMIPVTNANLQWSYCFLWSCDCW